MSEVAPNMYRYDEFDAKFFEAHGGVKFYF